jgi:hypothetical protein
MHFRVAIFFIRGLCFEPTSEGCNNAHLFVALAFLVYQVFSNTELVLLAILMIVVTLLGNETYIIASGLHGLRLVKNLMPSWASPMRKRVHALSKCENKNLATEAHLYVTRLAPYKLLKYKTFGDCLHSMNVPALVLECP